MNTEGYFTGLGNENTDIDTVARTLKDHVGSAVDEWRARLGAAGNYRVALKVDDAGHWLESERSPGSVQGYTNWNTDQIVACIIDIPATLSKQQIQDQVQNDIETWRVKAHKSRKLGSLEAEIQAYLRSSGSQLISMHVLDDMCKGIEHRHGRSTSMEKDTLTEDIQRHYDDEHEGHSPPALLDGQRWYPTIEIERIVQQMRNSLRAVGQP